MPKNKLITNFVCQECGYDSPSWLGKCPECNSWNSFKEFHETKNRELRTKNKGGFGTGADAKPQKLGEIAYSDKLRIQTEYGELNNVLGGGIVKGSATLIAGDPGIGKSTLLLQLALSLANAGKKVLYVSGEESAEQIKMRAERISEHSENSVSQRLRKSEESDNQKHRRTESSEFSENKASDNLLLLSLTDADAIVEQIEAIKPDLVVVDSIQTIESQNVSGLSGSVPQVRYGALQFVRSAKQNSIPIIIVGHVTKEGMVAGPMILSHMVDTVLFLEGERFTQTRILRSLKNRFGPVDEVGIFLMKEDGLTEANHPEQLFLNAGRENVPGSVLTMTLEGSRAFLVEIQALVVRSGLPMPRRVASGMDPRRVELLLAVLQKHCRLPLETMDVFVNVAGGLKLSDPGADVGVCLAVYSSFANVPLGSVVGIAEIGLLGELRMISGLEKRIKEAEKLGMRKIISAKTNKTLSDLIAKMKQTAPRSVGESGKSKN